jgi:hypothetical protein
MDIKTAGTLSSTTTVDAKVSTSERDKAGFDLPDHSIREPRVVLFSRALPTGTGKDKDLLRTTVKTVFGDRNEDGTARSGNITVELVVRAPQDQPVSLVKEAVAMLVAVARDPLLMDPLLEDGRFPRA